MLAMLVLAAAPAIAQIGQEGEQEGESGEVDQSFTVSGEGNSANDCAALLGGAQSGNSQDQTDVVQSGSAADDFEFDESGSTLTLTPEQAEECEQRINQAAVAAGKAGERKAAPAPAPAPKTEAKAAEAKAEAKKAEEKKELPKTGGSGASLLALGAGALLVSGGLLARRIFR